MNYKILDEKIVFDDHYKMRKAHLKHELFGGGEQELTRLCFDRGDSVAVVIYEKDTDSLLFTQQFRYPASRSGHAWMLELTAGSLNKDEDPKECAKREVEEEIGYHIKDLKLISTFFSSPGGSTEQVHLFYAEVRSESKKTSGGGMKDEKEDIKLIKIGKDQIQQMLNNNEFNDAKTIIGIQWFLNQEK